MTLPILDAQLADYAFFPLSYVIKDAGSITSKSLALAVQCLELLIKRGWRANTDPALSKELLVFLTIQLSKVQQDDSQISLLKCLNTLIHAMSIKISEMFVSEDSSAVAGQLLDTLLGIVKDSPGIEIQLNGIAVLKNLISVVNNNELLRKFLPGIVSQLSNILRPQTRRSYRILVGGIDILDILIRKTLSDELAKEEQNNEIKSWRKATSTQLLLALSNIVSLRYHDRSEVLDAFAALCASILSECQSTLENCRPIMLESLCIVSSQDRPSAKSTLNLILSNEMTNFALQELVYKWLRTLSRKLQSVDDQQAEKHVVLICEGYRALYNSDTEITSLNQELLKTIQECGQLMLIENRAIKQVEDLPDSSIRDLVVTKPNMQLEALGPLNTPHLRLLERLVPLTDLLVMYENENMDGTGLSSLWMLTRSLSDRILADGVLQEFATEPAISEQIVDLALDRAVSILSDTSEDIDWRSQALAIELVTLVAQVEKEEFRTSLIDTLFPLVELVGASNPFLRQYAITSLNVVSLHCGYTGPGDMIVQNVDYLVNAVSLKFNIFDVSPQAIQVLVVMLELSGSALIPYLDDLVDSIFGALAAYHGYPRLVEVMFSALAAIVKHGSSNTSSIMDVRRIEHKKQTSKLTQVCDIPAILDKLGCPLNSEEIETEPPTEDPDTALQTSTPSTELDTPQKPPKTYTIVQSVLRLSQHYLTHQEPYLRQRLLDLISIGCTSLSRNEDQFLPLINDIWPVVIQRLYDPEAIVSLAAMQALSAIFVGAGDFVATRIQDEWLPIRSLFRSIEEKATAERKGTGARGLFAYTTRLFEGMVGMLVQLILHVRVKADMEDDLFEMLGALARTRLDVREALDMLNPDALWLVLNAPGFDASKPVLGEFVFADVQVG